MCSRIYSTVASLVQQTSLYSMKIVTEIYSLIRIIWLRMFAASILLMVVCSSANANFDNWVKSFWFQAQAVGINKQIYDKAFRGISPRARIIKKSKSQPEFAQSVRDYVNGRVSSLRIKIGREKARQNSALLKLLERSYGVDRYTILAIWGMESSYGNDLKNRKLIGNTIQALATLAYTGGERTLFWEKQLLAALAILQRGDITPGEMEGSWAGAMGHTQFIPTTYEVYAVDHDRDGKRDIWNSIPDALASTANYLNKSGWVAMKTWGYEAELPAGFNYLLSDKTVIKSLSEWSQIGIGRPGGKSFPRPTDMAYLLLPAGHRGPAFLMLKNFRVIKRYNNADAYALAVGHLADRIRGGKPFKSVWPKDERPLTRSEKKELQSILISLGYPLGKVDGRLGSRSRAAIRGYQLSAGLVPDGYAEGQLLNRLRTNR